MSVFSLTNALIAEYSFSPAGMFFFMFAIPFNSYHSKLFYKKKSVNAIIIRGKKGIFKYVCNM